MAAKSLPPPRNLTVCERAIGSLIPYANNARIHSDRQIRKIQASLLKWGWTNPILIDRDGNIVCGHGRWEAAKLIGLANVPTIILDDLSEDDRRAYIIADNAIAEKSGWSKRLLSIELQGLIEIGYDVELTGLDTLEIDSLLSFDVEEPLEEEKVELPDERESPVTDPGDLWPIGDHRLMCADARHQAAYDRLLEGSLAQMIFTDPPFNCRIAHNVSGLGEHCHEEFVMASGELSDGEFTLSFLRPALRCLASNSAPGAIAYVCMDWRGAPQLLDAAKGVFAEHKNLIVWVKDNASMGAFYRSQHELIYVFKTTKGPHINNFGLGGGGRHRSNTWHYPGANTFRRGRMEDLADHPTVKPQKMVADAILDCSRRGGIILDAFAGSGTTLSAAEATGRRGYGIELDPRYCDVIVRRVEAATGKPARLETGETFVEIAAKRKAETPSRSSPH